MQTNAITVEIDLNTTLPDRYLGSTEDGPNYGPVSLISAIVDAAAEKLIAQGKKSLPKQVAAAIEERVTAMLDERLPAIFESALNEPVEISDDWGSTRMSKSLRELIGEHAREEMKLRSDRYGKGTVMDKVVREQIEETLRKDLGEEIAAARGQVKAKLTAKAAELLAAETLREAGIR